MARKDLRKSTTIMKLPTLFPPKTMITSPTPPSIDLSLLLPKNVGQEEGKLPTDGQNQSKRAINMHLEEERNRILDHIGFGD